MRILKISQYVTMVATKIKIMREIMELNNDEKIK